MTSGVVSSFSGLIGYDEVLAKLKKEECVVLTVNFLGYAHYFHSCVKLEVPEIQDPDNFPITWVDLGDYPDLFRKWSALIKESGEKFCTCGLKEGIIARRWTEKRVALRGTW
jgi:hypothetical protein